jgi:hypothetical protein
MSFYILMRMHHDRELLYNVRLDLYRTFVFLYCNIEDYNFVCIYVFNYVPPCVQIIGNICGYKRLQ